MLELAKVYKNTIYVYVSADKRYEYNVVVQSEPEKKTRLVVVTIHDYKYQFGDPYHCSHSSTSYNCYNYRVDSMLKHCQHLFDAGGLHRDDIGCFRDIICHAKEK